MCIRATLVAYAGLRVKGVPIITREATSCYWQELKELQNLWTSNQSEGQFNWQSMQDQEMIKYQLHRLCDKDMRGDISTHGIPLQVFPYTKVQLFTELLQPCLTCHVSVAKLYNREQDIHKVYTHFPLIVIADKTLWRVWETVLYTAS